jgi:hypothetical protein
MDTINKFLCIIIFIQLVFEFFIKKNKSTTFIYRANHLVYVIYIMVMSRIKKVISGFIPHSYLIITIKLHWHFNWIVCFDKKSENRGDSKIKTMKQIKWLIGWRMAADLKAQTNKREKQCTLHTSIFYLPSLAIILLCFKYTYSLTNFSIFFCQIFFHLS